LFNIHFFQRFHNLKKEILQGIFLGEEYRNNIFKEIEKYYSETPVVFNIETTNACNMKCSFCPRTTLMTRKIENLDIDIYKKIINQLRSWNNDEWKTWKLFVENEYQIKENEMNENHFYMYIIPRVLVLHGYGDPLLDKYIIERVEYISENNLESYFSCNPSNINLEKIDNICNAGLNYIKFSIDSTTLQIRGKKDKFHDYYPDIISVVENIDKIGSMTKVIITMIDLNRENQKEEWEQLKEYFKNTNVYIYLKSQDQTWYEQKEKNAASGKSICWSELCHFPWYAMTVKSNGDITMCSEDYNNSIILGDTKKETLYNIWNGNKYKEFRKQHMNNNCIYCKKNCDMKIFGNFL